MSAGLRVDVRSRGCPSSREGDDLAALLAAPPELEDGDVVVVAQKAVSKVEGRVVGLADVEPSARAVEIAGDEADPRRIEVILGESAASRALAAAARDRADPARLRLRLRRRRRLERARARTRSCCCPVDPDASARRLRARLQRAHRAPTSA